MTSPEPTKQQHNEASLVSEAPGLTPKKLLIYTLLGTVIIIISIGLIFSTPKADKKIPPATEDTIDIKEMNRSLEANLASLQRLNQQAQKNLNQAMQTGPMPTMATTTTIANAPATIPDETINRAYRARLNAPTLMYAAAQNNSPVAIPGTNAIAATAAIYAGKSNNADFMNQTTATETSAATVIKHPDDTIAAGEMIHAVLETAINSDLPGSVRAVVAMPVYGYTSAQILIPAGSRLLGQYASSIIQGQQRVLIVWNRVILPDGTTAALDSPSTDPLGQSGQGADSIETHFWARFGESTLLSILGAGTATVGVNNTDEYNSASEYRMAIAQSLNDSAAESLENSVNNSPTLHIQQGAAINVFVARDLSFYDVLNPGDNNG